MMKRKRGMSLEEFVAYYETVHSKLVDIGAPQPNRYFRKYLRPLDGTESEFDVIVDTMAGANGGSGYRDLLGRIAEFS